MTSLYYPLIISLLLPFSLILTLKLILSLILILILKLKLTLTLTLTGFSQLPQVLGVRP